MRYNKKVYDFYKAKYNLNVSYTSSTLTRKSRYKFTIGDSERVDPRAYTEWPDAATAGIKFLLLKEMHPIMDQLFVL